MSVGSIKGGGGRGGPKGPKGAGGASGKGSVGKAGSYGKADRSERLVGSTREADSAEGPTVAQQASQIARALKSGEIASKHEAARQLVAAILKDKLDLKSKALTSRVAEQLQEDPHLAQTLERIWQKG
jgi:hypothetical protein